MPLRISNCIKVFIKFKQTIFMIKSVAAVILGGGAGSRLSPLTSTRSKPAVPIAGKYRLVDIPIQTA